VFGLVDDNSLSWSSIDCDFVILSHSVVSNLHCQSLNNELLCNLEVSVLTQQKKILLAQMRESDTSNQVSLLLISELLKSRVLSDLLILFGLEDVQHVLDSLLRVLLKVFLGLFF
jgi:hypothetical protein